MHPLGPVYYIKKEYGFITRLVHLLPLCRALVSLADVPWTARRTGYTVFASFLTNFSLAYYAWSGLLLKTLVKNGRVKAPFRLDVTADDSGLMHVLCVRLSGLRECRGYVAKCFGRPLQMLASHRCSADKTPPAFSEVVAEATLILYRWSHFACAGESVAQCISMHLY